MVFPSPQDPILAYTAAEGEINQIQWGATQPDWIGEYCRYIVENCKKSFVILIKNCFLFSFSHLLQQESRNTASVGRIKKIK